MGRQVYKSLNSTMVRLPVSIQSIHERLGIPADYAAKTGLPCYADPTDLIAIGKDVEGRERQLRTGAASAWHSMVHAAEQDGVVLQFVSAYRSAEYQAGLIQRCLDRGEELTDILSRIAAPGFSEHQSGLALDVTTPGYEPVEEAFETSTAFAWLQEHASRFEFVMSFPKDNPFGIIYEPWHWCYRSSAET